MAVREIVKQAEGGAKVATAVIAINKRGKEKKEVEKLAG